MKIFIAKLSDKTTSQRLEDLFELYGDVKSARVATDRITGRSKRYGFVEIEDEEIALNAIEGLNDTEFEGSKIVVKQSEGKKK